MERRVRELEDDVARARRAEDVAHDLARREAASRRAAEEVLGHAWSALSGYHGWDDDKRSVKAG